MLLWTVDVLTVVVSTDNAWGVTMDCSGLLVMPGVLPWTVVVSTGNA